MGSKEDDAPMAAVRTDRPAEKIADLGRSSRSPATGTPWRRFPIPAIRPSGVR